MPSLRSSTIAALRQRIVSGENGSVNGIAFALRSGLSVAQDAVVPWRRLDREADGLEAADEFANVFPHLGLGALEDQLASFGYDRGRGHHGTATSCGAAVRHFPL